MDSTIITIPQELFATAESSSYSGTFAPEEIDAGPDTYAFDKPLEWSVTATNTGGAILIAGIVTGVGRVECARCLEEFEVDIAGEVEGFFIAAGSTPAEEWEEDEFEILPDDNRIDLAGMLKAAVLVDVPLVPLCREECQGICPDCGVNLNEQSCSCAEQREIEDAAFQQSRNPFAALSGLKLEGEDEAPLN